MKYSKWYLDFALWLRKKIRAATIANQNAQEKELLSYNVPKYD